MIAASTIEIFGFNGNQLLAVILMIAGGGWAAIKTDWRKLFTQTSKTSSPIIRGSDDPPPVGAVEWANDVAARMSGASAESKLAQILNGATGSVAMAARIAEQETPEPADEQMRAVASLRNAK